MVKVITCHNCGVHKQWVGKKPKWYSKIVKDWMILSENHNIKRRVEFCSKECLDMYK